jgi:hypothetical protein
MNEVFDTCGTMWEIGGRRSGRTVRSIKTALERADTIIVHEKELPKIYGPVSLFKYLMCRLWWWKYPEAKVLKREPTRIVLMSYSMQRADNIKHMIEEHRGEWFTDDAIWERKYTLKFPNGSELILTSASSSTELFAARLDSLVKDHDVGGFDERLLGHSENELLTTQAGRAGYEGRFTSYELKSLIYRAGSLFGRKQIDDTSLGKRRINPNKTGKR